MIYIINIGWFGLLLGTLYFINKFPIQNYIIFGALLFTAIQCVKHSGC